MDRNNQLGKFRGIADLGTIRQFGVLYRVELVRLWIKQQKSRWKTASFLISFGFYEALVKASRIYKGLRLASITR